MHFRPLQLLAISTIALTARKLYRLHFPIRRMRLVDAYGAAGWEWDGNWSWPKDYQHFSAGGG